MPCPPRERLECEYPCAYLSSAAPIGRPPVKGSPVSREYPPVPEPPMLAGKDAPIFGRPGGFCKLSGATVGPTDDTGIEGGTNTDAFGDSEEGPPKICDVVKPEPPAADGGGGCGVGICGG